MARSIVSGKNVLLVFNLVLLCLFADAEKYKDIIQESSGVLPFLQFTNDGLRVNFAGYHAEAGLGGLLDNSKTGGGLHASAGTPFGPQASAGLGGLLSGDNANTGGGLFAQAGLGNNRPSARAGLGGILDGSGKSNHDAAGGLFAGADLGNNQPGAQAGLGGVLDGNSNTPNDNNVPNITPTSHTNIQILSKSATRGHKYQRAIDTKSIITNEAVPESKYDDVNGQNAVENVQNIPIVQPGNNDLVSAKGVAEAEANVDAAIANNYWTSQQRPFVRRWYLRKILRGNPFRKQMIETSSVIPVSESELDTSSSTAFDAVSDKSSEEKIGYPDSNINYESFKKYKPEFVYNDVFNIPIST